MQTCGLSSISQWAGVVGIVCEVRCRPAVVDQHAMAIVLLVLLGIIVERETVNVVFKRCEVVGIGVCRMILRFTTWPCVDGRSSWAVKKLGGHFLFVFREGNL